MGDLPVCLTCGKRKAPRGRDVAPAMASDLCTRDCAGYGDAPRPGRLWPGEPDAPRGAAIGNQSASGAITDAMGDGMPLGCRR